MKQPSVSYLGYLSYSFIHGNTVGIFLRQDVYILFSMSSFRIIKKKFTFKILSMDEFTQVWYLLILEKIQSRNSEGYKTKEKLYQKRIYW